jgi:glycolate oxidase iron-sulfur subunit
MKALISPLLKKESYTKRAAEIVRSCVHCGFCNATCPTYRLSGEELEGPRGRIYLVKGLLEEGKYSQELRTHLDSCLLCRNCETTCPSGVEYGKLMELVRPKIYEATSENLFSGVLRTFIKNIFSNRHLFAILLWFGRTVRPFVPKILGDIIPPKISVISYPKTEAKKTHILLSGCVQPSLNPNIDEAAKSVFQSIDIELKRVRGSGCCGAIAYHLGDYVAAQKAARRNLKAWWPFLKDKNTFVVATSTGCGLHLKQYSELLAEDQSFTDKARVVSSLVRDPIEFIQADRLKSEMVEVDPLERVHFQSPCTLQHGQKLGGRVEDLLIEMGFQMHTGLDHHMCCGSAGTYSLFHPETANQLREQKLIDLEHTKANCIVTANVGCQIHLAQGTNTPILHWLELLQRNLRAKIR